jgi:hypothetical protein
VVGTLLETQFHKRTPQPDRVQLLRDTNTHYLHGHSHRHEFSRLCSRGLTEIKLHQLTLQARRFKLLIVRAEPLDLCL